MSRSGRLWRWSAAGEETGSMAMAMLLTLVGMMLTAVLVPIVLNQMKTTRSSVDRSRALHAAQAGLDVVLAQIRAANNGTAAGVLAKLPCGEISGDLGAGATSRYRVTVQYYREDPHGKDADWLRDNKIPCVAGGGTKLTPAFALVSAQGTDTATGEFVDVRARELRGTYTFQTTNQNIAGGLIHVFKTATSLDLCLDAGSGAPAANTDVRMQPCTAGSIQQKFAYNTDLTLTLVASVTGVNPNGMCLTVPTPHAVGKVAQFQPCVKPAPPSQRWSINDQANFEGTDNGATLNGYCLNVQNPNTPGSRVVLGSRGTSTCGQSYNNRESFSPEPAAGAGGAGPLNNQLVNFKQFGRCLDVTDTNVSSPYMIAWPCKQAPNPALVLWNQRWALPPLGDDKTGTGTISVTRSAVAYCLRSPGALLKYVTLVPCPLLGLPSDELTWTVYGATGSYATSYRIVDKAGFCLEPHEDPANPDYFRPLEFHQISKIYVAPCTASTLQKWNAPPNIEQATPIKDIDEK